MINVHRWKESFARMRARLVSTTTPITFNKAPRLLTLLFLLTFLAPTASAQFEYPDSLWVRPPPLEHYSQTIYPFSNMFEIWCSPGIIALPSTYNSTWFYNFQTGIMNSDSTDSADLFPLLEEYYGLDGMDQAAAFDSIYYDWDDVRLDPGKIKIWIYAPNEDTNCWANEPNADCAQFNKIKIHVSSDATASAHSFRTAHELEHVFHWANAKYRNEARGSLNEFIATSAEILFSETDWPTAFYNTYYDESFYLNRNYNPSRLFHAYMDEHHSGTAGDITDDLIYNWVQSDSVETRTTFYGLAHTMQNGSYGVPGTTASDKLGTLFHRYALAKYADDDTYASGLYGFGSISARTFALFDWIDEPGLLMRVEPPHFLVTASDSAVTDSTFEAVGDSLKLTACRTRDLGMRLWASEYLVFRGNFSDRAFTVNLRSKDAIPDSTEIHIGYLAYDAFDSVLYDHTLLSVVESVAVVQYPDTLNTTITIPAFGTTTKGIVIVASLVPNPIPTDHITCQDDWDSLTCSASGDCSEPLIKLEVTYDVKNILEIGGAYPTFQSAVNDAVPGDTLLVIDPGPYDPFSVNKSLQILADDTTVPVVVDNGTEGACQIEADGDNVTIKGITFKGNPTTSTSAVVLNEGQGTILEDCTIEPGYGATAAIEGQYDLNLINCILEADAWGVASLTSPSGPTPDPTFVMIQGCIFEGCGIALEDAITSHIERNVFVNPDTAFSSLPDTTFYNIFNGVGAYGCTVDTTTTNLSADPLFCNSQEGTGKYTLRWDSPIVASNNPWTVQVLNKDVECAWGELAGNTTLESGNTVTILEDVIVPSGKTLTLQTGTTLSFDKSDGSEAGYDTARNELHIIGSLSADASAGANITFTSAAPIDSAGDWGGISTANALAFTLKNATIEYADYSLRYNSSTYTNVVDSLVVANSGSYDVVCTTSTASPSGTFSDCTFGADGLGGVLVQDASTLSGQKLTFDNCAIQGSSTQTFGIKWEKGPGTYSGGSISGFTVGSAAQIVGTASPTFSLVSFTNNKYGVEYQDTAAGVLDTCSFSQEPSTVPYSVWVRDNAAPTIKRNIFAAKATAIGIRTDDDSDPYIGPGNEIPGRKIGVTIQGKLHSNDSRQFYLHGQVCVFTCKWG